MGTHPIFESDFDCLTDFVMVLRLILRTFSGNHVPRATCYTLAHVPSSFKRMDNFFENMQAQADKMGGFASVTKRSRTDTVEFQEEFYQRMRDKKYYDLMQQIVGVMFIVGSIGWGFRSGELGSKTGAVNTFEGRGLIFGLFGAMIAVLFYHWMLSRRCSRSLSLYVNRSGDLAFLTYPARLFPELLQRVQSKDITDDHVSHKSFVIVPAACAEVEVYAKGFDAAKSPLFDLKPKTTHSWLDQVSKYLIPKSTVLNGRINLIVPPGLCLDSEWGNLHTFVLQIDKAKCKDILNSVNKNKNVMAKSYLGRELLKIAADFEKKPW